MEQNEAFLKLNDSFAILNHLHGGYNGAFAFYSFLRAFQHRSALEDDITHTDRVLKKLSRWAGELMAGEVLVSRSWKEPESFEAQEAFTCLEWLHKDLRDVAKNIESIMRMKTQLSVIEDTIYIAAGVARVAQGRLAFVKNLLEFGQYFNHKESEEKALSMLDGAQHDMKVCQNLFDMLASTELPGMGFALELSEYASDLAVVLKTQAYETFIHRCYFDPSQITYGTIGGDKSEIVRWMSSGIQPKDAGYWRAYNIGPEEAVAWGLSGINSPSIAYIWQNEGFSAVTATPWIEAEFPPALASEWAEEGFTPDAAMNYIQENIVSPQQIPKDRRPK
jgi:hypothetical protein